MTFAYIAWTTALALVLIIQFVVASTYGSAVRVLIWLQGFYWLCSNVLRSIYLVVNQPGPQDVLFDRTMFLAGYEYSLTEVSRVNFIGAIVFVVTLAALRLLVPKIARANSGRAAPNRTRPGNIAALIAVLVACWAFRLLSLTGFTSTFSLVATLATLGGPLWILLGPLGRRSHRIILAAVLLADVAWSVVEAQKTAVLTVVAAALIRLGIERGTRIVVRLIPGAVALLFVAFAVIQPLHGVDTAERARASNQNALQAVATSVLQRTDVLTPVNDAIQYPYRPWLSLPDYLYSFATGVVPTGLHQSVGVRWNDEVKTASNQFQAQTVSIAPGTIAEGYVQGGLLGVTIEQVLLAALTVLIGSAITSRRFSVALAGATMGLDSSMFEGGSLWISESVSGVVQIIVLAGVVRLIYSSLAWQAGPQPAALQLSNRMKANS